MLLTSLILVSIFTLIANILGALRLWPNLQLILHVLVLDIAYLDLRGLL